RIVALTGADRAVAGDFEFDGFGVLSSTPRMDLDADGLDDLVVGAPGADVTTTEVIPAGGKAFVIYGASSRAALPASAVELGTRSFTGAGFFLVDEGTGRPTLFRDAPGEDNPLFVLDNGADAWYRFTTLGDGMPGNSIRILPGAVDGFLAPHGGSPSALVPTATRAGNLLTPQPFVDGAVGSMFVGDQFGTAGRMTSWSVYSGAYGSSQPRYVTPLIFKDTGDGRFEISGIGQAALVLPNQPQQFAFQLVSGSDAVGAGYYLGWYDGSATAGDNAGAIGYGTFGDTVRWLGPSQGAAGNVHVGAALAPVNSFVRTYSIEASVTTGAVLEFDLGRFLGWAGDPEAVGQAMLLLHAPDAAAPIAAPTTVLECEFSGGKLYFTAFTPDKGYELWVTNGTEDGTHLIADLNPGVVSSAPSRLTDVGGTLYFTANAGAAGTKLFKTTGEGATLVGEVPGAPSQFTVQLGHAELLAAFAGPADGVPDVDFELGIDVLREDGSVDALTLTLARDATLGNLDLDDLLADLQAALAAALAGDLAGDLSAGLSGDRFTLTANDGDIVRVTVRDGGALGFGVNQISPQSITLLAPAAPAAFDVAADVAFSLVLSTVGAPTATVSFTLNADATDGNASAADLAADLQALINPLLVARGFVSGAIQVTVVDGALQLSATDPNLFRVAINGATALGFTDGQASVRSVALAGAADAPANGQLPADLAIELLVTTRDGRSLALPLTLSGASNAGNTSLEQLAAQLQAQLDAALLAAGFSGTPVLVSTQEGRLKL
ncbi:MAG TPA: hypothetical protein VH741_05390, partial [Candidatus Limnocylindrales bacterium]